MPEFRVKWAAAGAAYAGMMFGIVQLVTQSGKLGLPELMIGAFMGGAMALPLTLCHVAAALAVLLVARRRTFVQQFAIFTALSFGAWLLMVDAIDHAFRALGSQSGTSLAYLAAFAVGTGACLVCMIAAGRRAAIA